MRPITPRRLARMRGVLERRQPDLTVVIEDVHDGHNVSAVLRSCDATGVPELHIVYQHEERPELVKGIASSAQRWLEVRAHSGIEDCYAELRQRGLRIVGLALSDEAVNLYDLDLTVPTALVFGNETRGLSDAARAGADQLVLIPMMGMVESLNISVACAVSLYEAQRQRRAAGLYATPRLTPAEIDALLRHWLTREDRDPAAADQPIEAAGVAVPKQRNRGDR